MPVDSRLWINTTLVCNNEEATDKKSLKCTWTHQLIIDALLTTIVLRSSDECANTSDSINSSK